VQARQRLAELMLELNQPDKAIALYRQVLAAMPQSTSAPYGMARAFVLKHDELTAQQILEQSLKNHPDDPASNTLLADLAIKSMGTDAYPAAQKLYEKALAGEPTRIDAAMSLARIYVAQGRTLDAAKALRGPAAADRRTAALHLFYADILAELRAYDLASAEYNTGTANDPNNAEAFYRWGKALATAAPQAAEKRLRNAIALNQEITPRTKEVKERAAEYHVELGLVQRNLADLGLGYTDYEKEFAAAIDADPFYANTYLEFARLQLKDGHEGTAVNWINDALHVAPGNTEAKRALAKILLNSKDPMRRDPEKAIALLSEAVAETQSRDLQVLVDLVNALSGQGRYDDALRQMDVVIPEAAARQIAGWQMELLRSMRAQLYLALVPTQEGGEPRFGVEGRHVHEPGDDPLPPVPQPDLYDTLRLSLDLSKPPGPGSVMDPVFLGEEYQREKARRDASGLQLMALPR
ncbi:MAG TPA: tetratricopeptide repeat protein, partial [Phycisphaerae bacterium]|nr:tetratricopeptide repeat protein [Phycisphaerae bacterium]